MRKLCLTLLLCLGAFAASLHGQERSLGLGHSPTAHELLQWQPTVLPDGRGLPLGSGTPAQGKKVYVSECAGCHGDHGQGIDPVGPQLVGGFGTLKSANPILTVGSFWPYATTVWDFIHRAMPYSQPGTLTANETYAVTAYLLHLNGIISENATMNRRTLPKVRMPNRDGFVADPRPDVTCPRKQQSDDESPAKRRNKRPP